VWIYSQMKLVVSSLDPNAGVHDDSMENYSLVVCSKLLPIEENRALTPPSPPPLCHAQKDKSAVEKRREPGPI
jgi:hypothetical protein